MTIWSLTWFILFVGICGLAVDVTDGFRNKTMLQSSADASALAAVIDLPDADAARATAVTYAAENMRVEVNGSILMPEDVRVGGWDAATRTLDTASTEPDAVMVTVKRAAENANAVPTNFLRVIGLLSWDVTAQAVAQRFTPGCLRDGLVARGIVDITSNNKFVNEICVHGEKGVHMQNHNYYEAGVTVSMPDPDYQLKAPGGGMGSNPGLEDALHANHLYPRLVNHIDEIIQGIVDKDPAVVPDYIDLTQNVIEVDDSFDFSNVIPGRIYHAVCKPQRNLIVPSGIVLEKIALVADCQVHIGAKATLMDMFVASRSGAASRDGKRNRGAANITTAAGVQLGRPDDCAEGGGVQMFSTATMAFSSSTTFDGVQLVAAADINLGARDMGINGISAQAGGNIYMTANNTFGLCVGGVPYLSTVGYYRLVL